MADLDIDRKWCRFCRCPKYLSDLSMEENGEAESDLGSIISLQSLDDAADDKPKRPKKSKHRSQSPYTTQSYGTTTKSQFRKTGHNAWSTAIRNGFTGLSSENTPSNRITSSHLGRKSRSRTPSQTGPFSRDEHVLAAGKPAYKSQEDYYDEILELRQVIKNLKTDNGVIKTKLQRVTQENIVKDRQIKDFLNPNKQPDEMRRTLTDKNAGSSAVIVSLKQKLHLMECNVKDKESELRKLKSDLKSTNIEELRIQMETYYDETQRLQQILSSVYSKGPGTRNIPDARSTSRSSSQGNSSSVGGLDKVELTQLNLLQDEKQRLESENQSLKKDLLLIMDGQLDKENRNKRKVDYADMNRVQMLQKINELEKLIEKKETVEMAKSSPEINKESVLNKQREMIENLKRDRTYYREEAGKLRDQLDAAEDEISVIKEELRKLKEKKRFVDTNEENKQTSILKNNKKSPTKQNISSYSKKKINFDKDSDKEVKKKNFNNIKEDEAAIVLQRNWRKYKHEKTSTRDYNDIVRIQSTLRAYAAQRRHVQLLSNDDEDLEWDDAVIRVQSMLRGHHVRKQYITNEKDESIKDGWKKNSKNNISFKRSSFLTKSRGLQDKTEASNGKRTAVNTTHSSDDEDVIVGRSRYPKERGTSQLSDVTGSRDVQHRNVNHNDSEDDDVEVGRRFDSSYLKEREIIHSPQSSHSSKMKMKKVDENEEKRFFGIEKQPVTHDASDNPSSSLDKFFSFPRQNIEKAGRSDKGGLQAGGHDAGSDPESEENIRRKTASETAILEEKPLKKSLFSWTGIGRNTSNNAPVPAPRSKTSLKKKETSSTNVWTSQPSDIYDDDDDVVVTPKISRKNPTKTASLLDELF